MLPGARSCQLSSLFFAWFRAFLRRQTSELFCETPAHAAIRYEELGGAGPTHQNFHDGAANRNDVGALRLEAANPDAFGERKGAEAPHRIRDLAGGKVHAM